MLPFSKCWRFSLCFLVITPKVLEFMFFVMLGMVSLSVDTVNFVSFGTDFDVRIPDA